MTTGYVSLEAKFNRDDFLTKHGIQAEVQSQLLLQAIGLLACITPAK